MNNATTTNDPGTTADTKMVPCRFCGAADPYVQLEPHGACVKCGEPHCGAAGPWAVTEALAIERWNRPMSLPTVTPTMIAAGMLNRSHIEGESVEEGEAEVAAIFKAMHAVRPGVSVTASEEDFFVLPGIPNECAGQVRVAASLCERNDYLTCASTLHAIAEAMQPGLVAAAKAAKGEVEGPAAPVLPALVNLTKLDRDLGYIQSCLDGNYQGAARATLDDIRAQVASTRRALQPGADIEPVARLHIRLEDDGLAADVEVLDGTNLQVEHSPVNVYLAPPADTQKAEQAPADTEAKAWATRNLLLDVSGLLRSLVEDGKRISVKEARDVLYKVYAAQRG
jgi:hypothetical protein